MKRSYNPLYPAALMYIFIQAAFIITGSGNAFGQHMKDTMRFRRTVAQKASLVLSDSTLNAIGIDSLLNKIENVHHELNRINNTNTIGYDTRDIDEDFPGVDSSVDIIDENLSLYNNVLDVKNLQMFNVLLGDLQDQLSEWRTSLFAYNRKLLDMNAELAAFKKDTILRQLIADTAFSNLYKNELADLKDKWKQAIQSSSGNLSRINQLQATISNEYFETIELQDKTRSLLRKVSSKSRSKEYPYLWDASSLSVTRDKASADLVKKSYQGQRRILKYYFLRNSNDQLWMLLVGILFMFWIFRNFTRLEKYKSIDNNPSFSSNFITKISVLPTLIVLFNLAPFFDIHPPTAYVEIMELLMVIVLTILLRKRWPKDLFKYWLYIGGLYIVFSITANLLTPAFIFRLVLVAINVVAVLFGLRWLKLIKKHALTFSGMIRFVSVLFIVLNVIAVLCNLFGRLSLAKIFSITAIFGLTQIIGLSVFIQIMLDSFRLQTVVNQLKGGITARLNFNRIEKLLSRGLKILSVFIWVTVFTISLNMYNLLFKIVSNILTKPRVIGNTSFEIANILWFILIIYVSNLLQQGIGSLYPKTEDTWDPEVRKNGSRLAITRLVLIIIGFIIAVAASGLPIDKITIVLGALGVGIGLGLQSIVNNLVSGVILIFEQPFRIGDYIELGDKRGRVLDIGIRSSKLVMEEGAEIILPNGDLLSGRVINWTLRSDDMRVDLPMSLETGHSFQEVRDIISELLNSNEQVLKTAKSEILLTAITEKSMNINVQVWIINVHRMQSAKSELLSAIHDKLAEKEIKMV